MTARQADSLTGCGREGKGEGQREASAWERRGMHQ